MRCDYGVITKRRVKLRAATDLAACGRRAKEEEARLKAAQEAYARRVEADKEGERRRKEQAAQRKREEQVGDECCEV